MKITIDDVNTLGLDSNRISDFYKDHWTRKIALSIPSFYKWQFNQSPSNKNHDHCIVAIDEDSDQIIGTMGLNKRPFYLNEKEYNGAELTTWVVSEQHIGTGVGAKILKKTQSKYETLIGMGISELALPIYLRSGFRYIRAIPRYLRVFDFEKIEKYAEYTPLAKKLAKQWSKLGKDIPFCVEPVTKEGICHLEPVLRKEFNYFIRDKFFLDWRYSQHPVFKYNQYLIYSNGQNKGNGVFVCLRIETGIEGLKILHVLDCIGAPEDIPTALSFIDDYCKKESVHLADFYCTSTKVSHHFVGSGWFSINDDLCLKFPHLFHPVELRTPPTTSLIYWSKDHFVDMADIGKLYITKQDADLDRPTIETYSHLNENQ